MHEHDERGMACLHHKLEVSCKQQADSISAAAEDTACLSQPHDREVVACLRHKLEVGCNQSRQHLCGRRCV
jgi:hypothetical protein